MHSEHRFSDLSESLRNGFIVDKIVLTLARAEKGEELQPKDREIFNLAVAMLGSAEAGYHWLDNPEMTSETKDFATFFGQAVNALPAVHEPSVFLESISELKATAAQLSKGEPRPSIEKIHSLRTFFYNAAQSELDRTEQLLGEGSGVSTKWTLTSE